MNQQPIRFGIRNVIPGATITATPAPIGTTPIEWLKNEWRARKCIWTAPGGDIVIEGELTELTVGEFFALPGSELLGKAQVKLELFDDMGTPVDVLNMGFVEIAKPIPIGQWRAGINPYGIPRDIDRPDTFVYWFDAPVYYIGYKLTISQSQYTTDPLSNVQLRMLVLGERLQLDSSFEYGSPITFVTSPDLAQTGGGSWVPVRKQIHSRTLAVKLSTMSDNDRAGLWEMESTLEGSPFIVSAFPSSDGWRFDNYSYLARFGSPIEFAQTFEGVHSATVQFLEV